ncbi:glycosyltransferase family 1 protein [Diplodia corticola]|uniref:UDP-N-acetylglucosamine transferase subunit ALG14 n=1 Tax=Diplodia corticola TaxID=236234 RepID=A0A1J9QRF7_9PEZI|nr:glycosyltransferase family 1 protein [Diplodia corticola]OJD31001.1 glycosyltransferase family 1 protein [Diplodia corticola]
MAVPSASPPPPITLLLFNGLIILAFLSIPFIALRILFLLPPLRPPPRPRRRPGGSNSNSTTTTEGSAAAAAAAESLLLQGAEQDDDNDDGDGDGEGDEERYRRRHAIREATRLVVVLGSGGHTAEMLAMLRKLDARTFLRSWSQRTYVVSEGDGFSAERAREFEEGLLDAVGRRRVKGRTSKVDGEEEAGAEEAEAEGKKDERNGNEGAMAAAAAEEQQQQQQHNANASRHSDAEKDEPTPGTYTLHTVPRARAIHQPLLTTPLSALRCLASCLSILHESSNSSSGARSPPPDLILANGPGTAVVVILAAVLLRFFDLNDARGTSRIRTVYVESWARVTRLSLSGRLLLPVVDRFVVQWEGLVGRTGGKGEFLGVLV